VRPHSHGTNRERIATETWDEEGEREGEGEGETEEWRGKIHKRQITECKLCVYICVIYHISHSLFHLEYCLGMVLYAVRNGVQTSARFNIYLASLYP